MIVISSSMVLGAGDDQIDERNPRIGWQSIVTASNVSADQANALFPVTNLGNPFTYSRWAGLNTLEQSIRVTLASARTVNYLGIARHNLGSSAAGYVLEYTTNGTDWLQALTPRMPPDDTAVLHEFDDVFARIFRLRLTPGSAAPSIAVLYLGQVLRLQRRIYVGHTPIVYGRRSTVSSGFSESGQFLGRVLRRQMLESSVSMQNITPEFYRNQMDPFFEAAPTTPFFFAWRPSSYPREVGYAWVTGDPDVSNQRANGMMQASMSMMGIR